MSVNQGASSICFEHYQHSSQRPDSLYSQRPDSLFNQRPDSLYSQRPRNSPAAAECRGLLKQKVVLPEVYKEPSTRPSHASID